MATRPSKVEHVSSVTGGQQMSAHVQSTVGQSGKEISGGVEQLKMFMTPREIHARWQPLDADRQDRGGGSDYELSTYTPKTWNTGQTHPTDVNEVGTNTMERAQRRAPGFHYGAGGNDTGTIRRTRGGGKYRAREMGGGGIESDDELWDRKLEETQEYPQGGQHDYYGSPDPLKAAHSEGNTMGTYEGRPTVRPGERAPRSSAWNRHDEREQAHNDRRMEQDEVKQSRTADSLYDSIAEKGVLGPIRLGRQIGSQGKKEIVGGHHRLAAATDIDPDRLVPVLHDETIWDAQKPPKGGYPYA